VDFRFSPNINVFIGENGTGKTHVLKLLYSVLWKNSGWDADSGSNLNWHNYLEKLFQAPISKLKRKNIGFEINWSSHLLNEHLNEKTAGGNYSSEVRNNKIDTLFLPPNEILSSTKGFINLYRKQETGFERVWFDLAVALDGGLLKNQAYYTAKKLVSEIETAINGTVVKEDGRFFVNFNDASGKTESPMVAQGINKLAQLIYLVLNGSINAETVLFWDEPEVNLNPKYIGIVAKFIQTLARAGVQIFIASHDYLLIHCLSLSTEYKLENGKTVDTQFFSFVKTENGTIIESGATLAKIETNVILDEYAALQETEFELYQKLFPDA
jgi:predicted ATPase